MTKTFTGDVLLPGEAGGGLAATLSLDPERVTLTSGDNQLGSWDRSDYLITPERNGSFNLTLGGESVLFRPDSPSDFAAVSEVPLAETVSSRAQHIRPLIKDDDAYLDELVAFEVDLSAAVHRGQLGEETDPAALPHQVEYRQSQTWSGSLHYRPPRSE